MEWETKGSVLFSCESCEALLLSSSDLCYYSPWMPKNPSDAQAYLEVGQFLPACYACCVLYVLEANRTFAQPQSSLVPLVPLVDSP